MKLYEPVDIKFNYYRFAEKYSAISRQSSKRFQTKLTNVNEFKKKTEITNEFVLKINN